MALQDLRQVLNTMSPVPGTGLLFPSNKPDDEDGKTNENGKAGEFAEKTSNTSLHEHRVKQSPENNYDQSFLPKFHIAILTPPGSDGNIGRQGLSQIPQAVLGGLADKYKLLPKSYRIIGIRCGEGLRHHSTIFLKQFQRGDHLVKF